VVPGRRGVFVQEEVELQITPRSQRTGPEKSGEGTSTIPKKSV
jgi:hypothetical protein